MKKVNYNRNFCENGIVIAREQSDRSNPKSNVWIATPCIRKSRNDKKINVRAESCGSILSEFRGLCSHEQGNRTWRTLTKRVANSREIRQKTIARAGFGMMFAIIITILVATLGVLAVRFSSQTLNTTTNEYIAIQLDLYLNSTTELAILYVQRNGFVCVENATNCDVGEAGTADRRANVTAPIEKYINYGEYRFKYMITPLANYDGYNPNVYTQVDTTTGVCTPQNKKPCFKEETKNVFVLDISGSVTNPLTNQTLRVNKRQVIKP